MTTMNTAKLAAITAEIYQSMGLSELTDERTDELITNQLNDAGIDIDEDGTPDYSECEYTRQAVRRALEIWSAEVFK